MDPFVITYTGRKFSFDNFGPDDIDIRDIAHSLSNICRFTGHVATFYSVAQHSLFVSEKIVGGPTKKLIALLHDAHEAYTSDLSRPLKKWLEAQVDGSPYRDLQCRIDDTIFEKYGLPRLSVDYVDRAAAIFEAEAFLGLTPDDLERHGFPMNLWGLWTPWEPEKFAGSRFVFMEPPEVEAEFLRRFEDLMREVHGHEFAT